MTLSKDTVLEAVLEWARAEIAADQSAAEINAIDRALATDRALAHGNRAFVRLDAERYQIRARAQAELSRACKDADDAEHKAREIARAYIEQESAEAERTGALGAGTKL